MFKTLFLKEMKDVLRDKRSVTLLIIFPFVMMAALTIFYDKLLVFLVVILSLHLRWKKMLQLN
ncbi:hypothetical protein ACA29_09720 [Lederbergia galactosidilytica]|uniref:Uncharacterized protein n=1 Tax=Lederbergia galactosidilytica TaxID=217031 RepID=A0A0Q9XZX6_9BACI|nr:hypothetical protein ACA29_09720 [Lederbergia galactosidilytica]